MQYLKLRFWNMCRVRQKRALTKGNFYQNVYFSIFWMYIILRLVLENFSRIAGKISFSWGPKHDIYAEASFSADVMSWFLRNDTLIFTSFMLYMNDTLIFTSFIIRPSSDGTYYGMVMSVRPSVRPGLRPSVRPSVRHSFPHFSPTCFDILIWNFVYHFIFMHVRSSSNAINFRHFLQELCSFLTSNSYKYAVFRTFLLHALTYWVQILYVTLF